ncbi:MAG: hypothetical protein WBA23_21775 [Tunicatimonas sp.]|uniref:hypothetical protein n=1 Tax=Tunicatimonas sp. TaxID=1940096 RepID=UPI003C71FBD4
MKIACIGWGSLVWQPKDLIIQNEWHSDGPMLPVEFTRQSMDGRLTLVITQNVNPVRTLWALMSTTEIEQAKRSLLNREGIPEKRLNNFIGSVSSNEETADPIKIEVKNWLNHLDLDAAIWTNLPPKFEGINYRIPTLQEAITYLKSLDVNTRNVAEEYIRKAPKQIDTEYRRGFEKELGWTCVK